MYCGPGPSAPRNTSTVPGLTTAEKRMIYVGTTSYSLHRRALQHYQDIVAGRTVSSAIAKHHVEYYGDMVPNFVSRIVGCFNLTLKRYIF